LNRWLAEFAGYFQHITRQIPTGRGAQRLPRHTIGVVRRVADKYSTVSFLEFAEPIGKGGALIEGLKLAPLADLIGYVDADGATSPKPFMSWCGLIDRLIASSVRAAAGSVLHQTKTWMRRFASRCFTRWCSRSSG